MSEVPENWRQPFPEDEISFILSAILRCAATVKKETADEHENPITIRLWKKLLRDAELNKRPTHLDIEAWELDEKHKAGKIGRLDLRFLFSTGALKPWPCFAIEAKRLHVKFSAGWKSLVYEYVTSDTAKPIEEEQGMMCFISGRYSRGLHAGAMLGYVFDGDVEAARTSIAKAVEQHAKKLKLSLNGWVGDSSVIASAGISESRHDLAEGINLADLCRGRFTIFHMLVPV